MSTCDCSMNPGPGKVYNEPGNYCAIAQEQSCTVQGLNYCDNGYCTMLSGGNYECCANYNAHVRPRACSCCVDCLR